MKISLKLAVLLIIPITALLRKEKMYGNIKDTIYNGEMAEQLAEMRTSFELEKQEERIKHLNEREAINKDKLEAEKTISMYITIGFIIFAVFALIIFFVINQQYQIKKRSNEILQKQKEEISAMSMLKPHSLFHLYI